MNQRSENPRGITKEGNFSKEFPGSVAVVSSHSLAAGIMKLRYSKKLLHRIDPSIPAEPEFGSHQWQSICVPNVFQPSAYVAPWRRETLKSFAGQRVLGLVLRFGAKAADWTDDGMFSPAGRTVRRYFRGIHDQMVASKASRLFVSTDSEIAEQIIGRKMGKRMLVVPRLNVTRGEHTEEAIVRRLVELEALGKCVALLLTPQNEFSDLAIAMSGGKASVRYLTIWSVCLKSEME